ncbi:Alt [Micropterus dolomieu adomavirus 1]
MHWHVFLREKYMHMILGEMWSLQRDHIYCTLQGTRANACYAIHLDQQHMVTVLHTHQLQTCTWTYTAVIVFTGLR